MELISPDYKKDGLRMNYFHSGWRDELTAVHSARPPARGSQMSAEVLELLEKEPRRKQKTS